MLWRVFCGLVALFVFSNAQVLGKKTSGDEDSENPHNWINIDSERNNDVDQQWTEYGGEVSGSGSGIDDTDDEDLLQGSGSGSGSGVSVFTTKIVDQPPRVDAGPDITLRFPERSAILCGNKTTDDHGIAVYQWMKISALAADMMGAREVCVRLSNLQQGDYTFMLQVTDTAGNIGKDEVRVFVQPPTTTQHPLSPCEQLRDASKHLLGNYVPRCTSNGDYDSLQCRGHESTGTCWCSDLSGAEIPGTNIHPAPDCENGRNLPPCVFKMVQQTRSKLLGVFRPVCTIQGDFDLVQCDGSTCFCVEPKTGVRKAGTEVFKPDMPNCSSKPVVIQPTPKPPQATPMMPRTTQAPKDINIEDKGLPPATEKGETTVSNESGPHREPSSAAHMISQPGILAAIIGGSVVLLLCAILLVMFIVYRMRKKDEGSYALDEPKKMPNYSYQRAPDKEFYA